jgi:copper(I)-binding protein
MISAPDNAAGSSARRWSAVAFLAIAAVIFAGLAIAIASHALFATTPVTLTGTVRVADATVTQAPGDGVSAVSLRFANHMNHPVEIVSVSSPEAAAGMLQYDQDMLVRSDPLTEVASLQAPAGRVVVLSVRGYGAMLMATHQALVVNGRVPLEVAWVDANGTHHVSLVFARVVARPAHLHFGSMGTGT